MLLPNDLRERADRFAHRFHGETNEAAEAKTFMDELFKVFGLDRYALARFEYPTRRHTSGRKGRADLFWRGKLLIEAKSGHLDKDADWDNTLQQALDYVRGLHKPMSRPEYLLLVNFKRLKLYQLHNTPTDIRLKPVPVCDIPLLAFADNLAHFSFFLTAQKDLEDQEIRVNQQAAQLIATVYDSLNLHQYGAQNAAVLLSQVLFCLFAEDTDIFKPLQFTQFIQPYQQEPQLLGQALTQLFTHLNTPPNQPNYTPPPQVQPFPYINGSLFSAALPQAPPTGAGVYDALYNACLYDWSAISPEIFGSLFQAVMNPQERRTLGAHYTSETNILRLLKPLCLDALKNEFTAAQYDKRKLERFRQKLNKLRFLDPACGCGNFLVVTYRELRLLDMQVIAALQGNQLVTDTALLSNVPLTNFYGYEIDPTSAQIATIAMWLTEHQLNTLFLNTFGVAKPSIPLHDAAQIINANALHIPWQPDVDFIIGNPPFVGSKMMTEGQRNEVKQLFSNKPGSGILDYVTAWYKKAADYIQHNNPNLKCAFVSTSSITQGEQVGVLWSTLFNEYGITIHFAHQTFKWTNEAKGLAAVHCVIIGFGKTEPTQKLLFEYPDIKGEPTVTVVKNINPYLVEGRNIFIVTRQKPIGDVPAMSFGNMPLDGGHLLIADEEIEAILASEPPIIRFIKPLISAHEFLNGKKRWCFWLVDAEPNELKQSPEIMRRIKAVKAFRESSIAPSTQKFGTTPHTFRDKNNPDTFILIPRVSSENREYIPIGFFDKNSIPSDTCMTVPNGTLYLFGQLTSKMHMAWVKYVCGRLKSDYRYSKDIVYNNYPFPQGVPDAKKQAVVAAAEAVLHIRAAEQAKGNTLAHLYDPLTMPLALQKAHQTLDKAVDKCYRDAPFTTDARRIEFLFDLYEQYTAGLFATPKKKKQK
ncbi:MAG TPA: N-6 DNA methylase [Chitinophagales bacterium]|nr:N-6 DNA methylase [Chitinophagales bacterium]